MALNFPTSPSLNQIYDRWMWNGDRWVAAPAPPATAYLPLHGGTMSGPILQPVPPATAAAVPNRQYVDEAVATQALYQGVWTAATNDPDLSAAATHRDGYMWLVTTPDPNLPFTVTATGIAGLTGNEVHNGDRVIWSVAAAEFQIVPGGGLTMTQGDARYLQLIGGTMTGDIVLDGDAAAALNPVPLQQLTAELADYLPLAGGTVTGNLAVNGSIARSFASGGGDPWAPPANADVMNVTTDSQVVLPAPAPDGRVIRVINQMQSEVSFTTVGGAANFINTLSGWLNVGAEFWTGISTDVKMTELAFIAANGAWYVLNQGPALRVGQATQNAPATMLGKVPPDVANPPTMIYSTPGSYVWTCQRTGRYQIMAAGPGGGGAAWVGDGSSSARYATGSSGGVAQGILRIAAGQILQISVPRGGAAAGSWLSTRSPVFGTQQSSATTVSWPYLNADDGSGPIAGLDARYWYMYANFGVDGGYMNALTNGFGDAPNISGNSGFNGSTSALTAQTAGRQITGTSWAGPVQLTSGHGGNMLSDGGAGSALIAYVGP